MYSGYLKIAVRSILKNKWFSVINITGLSIGVAVFVILALWVLDELSFNHRYTGHNQIARVIQNVTKNGEVVTWRHVPVPLAEELRKNYDSDFEKIAHITVPQEELLSFENMVLAKRGRYAEPEFFELFSINLISGSANQLKGTSSIFLSESTAKAFFGNSDALNKAMTLNSPDTGPLDVLVAGVYEDFPKQSDFEGADFIAPWDIQMTKRWIKDMEDPWKFNFVELYVKIEPTASFGTASVKIKDAKLRNVNNEIARMRPELFLHPMNDWHLYSEFKNGKKAGGRIQYVWLFSAVGIFILTMACINFMNFTTAQSTRLSKEIGVRKSIGSFRRQLVIRFFTESFLISLLSFCIALILIVISLPAFTMLAGKQIMVPWREAIFWMLSLVSCCIIALMCGCYPAVNLSSISAIQALKGFHHSGKSAMLRRVLVVLQFTISMILIVVSITVSQQIRFAMDRPIGYDHTGLITVTVKTDVLHSHLDAFRARLVERQVAVSVAEAFDLPTVRSSITTGLSWQGKDPNIISGFAAFSGSKEYGPTIGWKITQGRDFYQDGLSDTTSIIINEAARKYMGLKDPIGEVVQWWDDKYEIIGVVDNVTHESPYQTIQPSVYTLLLEPGVLIIRLNPTSQLSVALSTIEATFKDFKPNEPFSYQFVENEYAKKFETEERVKKLTEIFSVIAIFISCLGLFGLVAYIAETKTKEIGVRKVLGASVINIWIMLSRDFVILVAVSGAIAVPLGFYIIKSWLENYDYRIHFTWLIFVEAIFSVLIITLATASFQTISAARRNPVKSLRKE